MIAAAGRQPCVVIVNPGARGTSAQRTERVVETLASSYRCEVWETTERGAGIGLAAQASDLGIGLLVAYGGDGLVNEVVNGLAGSATTLGVVPGGTMNVFARSLGLPRDEVEAAEHIASGRTPVRKVNLGKMDDRYFTFAAGCGFDAETARLVESGKSGKRRFGEPYLYWSAWRILSGSHRHRAPNLTLSGSFGEHRVAMAVACNTGPYAYFGGRSVRLAPQVDLDAGLDVFALKRMRIEALPFYVWRAAVSGDVSRHRDALYLRDLDSFTITSDEPFARHVDGEPLPDASASTFRLAPGALEVIGG